MFTSVRTYCRLTIVLIIGISHIEGLYDSERGNCFFDDWTLGECKIIHECPEIIRQFRARQRPNIVSCGFDGLTQLACCSMPLPIDETETAVTEITTTRTFSGKYSEIRKSETMCEQYIEAMPISVSTQIVGGELATRGEYPHMVALGYDDGNDLNFDCGGTLISDRYVLTAAHCVVLRDRSPPIVGRMGIVDLQGTFNKSDTDYYIDKVVSHPEYNMHRYYHDIALLRFNRSVIFTTLVYPACLDTDSNDPHSLMDITGWGTTRIDRSSKSRYLMKGNVSAVELSECNITFTKRKEFRLPNGLIPGQLCALDKHGLMDTCGGDSGGPLQIRYSDDHDIFKLIGATSFGRGCSGGIPAVYTRISSYLGWIEGIVWP